MRYHSFMGMLVMDVDEQSFFRETRKLHIVDRTRRLIVEPCAVGMPCTSGLHSNGKPIDYAWSTLYTEPDEQERHHAESIARHYRELIPHASKRRALSPRAVERLRQAVPPPGALSLFHKSRVLNAILNSHIDYVEAADPVADLWVKLEKARNARGALVPEPDLVLIRETFLEQARRLEHEPWGLTLDSKDAVVKELRTLVEGYCSLAAQTESGAQAQDVAAAKELFAAHQRTLNDVLLSRVNGMGQ